MRHYVRLSQRNASIDANLLSARFVHHEAQPAAQRERWRGFPAFADIHPLAADRRPCRARSALIAELAHWLKELTGMPAVAMSPKAGAHGELCGLLAIRAAVQAQRGKAHAHSGARIRPRHQSGDGRDRGLHRGGSRRHRQTAASISAALEGKARRPMSPASC